MPPDTSSSETTGTTITHQQYRLIHDIYVLLDAGDRQVLRRFDLTPSHYTLLALVESGEGQRLTSLSDRLMVARSTITRLIDQMESRGWVCRVGDPADRRAQRVTLTPDGVVLLRHARAAHEHSLEDRLQTLDASDQQQLAALLEKMRAGLRAALDLAEYDK